MRFSKKKYLDILQLHGYERAKNAYRIEGSILKSLGVKAKHCDNNNTGSCADCNICPLHGRAA